MMTIDEMQTEYDALVKKREQALDELEKRNANYSWEEYCEVFDSFASRLVVLSEEIRKQQVPVMSKMVNYGDIFTFKDFIEACECGCFCNNDGHGRYATETEISNINIFPSDVISKNMRTDFTHVVWFNK